MYGKIIAINYTTAVRSYSGNHVDIANNKTAISKHQGFHVRKFLEHH